VLINNLDEIRTNKNASSTDVKVTLQSKAL